MATGSPECRWCGDPVVIQGTAEDGDEVIMECARMVKILVRLGDKRFGVGKWEMDMDTQHGDDNVVWHARRIVK